MDRVGDIERTIGLRQPHLHAIPARTPAAAAGADHRRTPARTPPPRPRQTHDRNPVSPPTMPQHRDEPTTAGVVNTRCRRTPPRLHRDPRSRSPRPHAANTEKTPDPDSPPWRSGRRTRTATHAAPLRPISAGVSAYGWSALPRSRADHDVHCPTEQTFDRLHPSVRAVGTPNSATYDGVNPFDHSRASGSRPHEMDL